MRINDISIPISPDIPVWPGDQKVVLDKVSSMDAGAYDTITCIVFSIHTGSHFNALNHFLNGHRFWKPYHWIF
jgi:arylformamidase